MAYLHLSGSIYGDVIALIIRAKYKRYSAVPWHFLGYTNFNDKKDTFEKMVRGMAYALEADHSLL